MKRRVRNKISYLICTLFFVCGLSAQNKVDTVYIYKTDTITISPVIPSFPGFGAIPRPSLKTNNAFSASFGASNMYDTYLSPLEYKGYNIRLMYEQMRRTTWFDYRFYKQQVFEIDFAKGDNPAKNASEYWFLASYRLGGHYRLYNTDAFRLGVGGFWDVNAGVLYNERNGNNPATARA